VPINLGATPGINDMWVDGQVVGSNTPGPRPGGSTVGTYYATEPSVLTFDALGSYVCPNSEDVCGSEGSNFQASFVATLQNLAGTMVAQGPGTLPLFVDGAPVQYSVDGSGVCNGNEITLKTECHGRVNLNASKGVYTPGGGTRGDPTDSVDTLVNSTLVLPGGGSDVSVDLTITYDAVESGHTIVVASSDAGGTIDPNFRLDVPGLDSFFFDITMSPPAAVTGEWIRICGDYPEAVEEECKLRILHNDEPLPNLFVNRTLRADDELCPFPDEETLCPNPDTPEEDFLCINTVTNQMCASVDSLSPFVFGHLQGSLAVAPILAALDQPVTAAAVFCDPDIVPPNTPTATMDWGDGSIAPATFVADESGCFELAEAGHTYADPGVYTVTMTVIDDERVLDTQVFQYAVIYDPSGGFVTGGGWIDSPAGAHVEKPTLTGKANFGFVSKYKKGASVPTGNTEFQFKVADLNFKSTSYDWLVIAGTKAQFKGEGTINGEGTYRFMLTANDDADDTFRIRIWTEVEETAEEIVTYDNGSDQAIGGGSVVIHKAK